MSCSVHSLIFIFLFQNNSGIVDEIYNSWGICVIYSNRTRVKCFAGDIYISWSYGPINMVNGTNYVGSTPGSLLDAPDMNLPSNYTYWRSAQFLGFSSLYALNPLIGRSTVDGVDRLFVYGTGSFCSLGIQHNYPDCQGCGSGTYGDASVATVGGDNVVWAYSYKNLLCFGTSDEVNRILCYGENKYFQLGVGSTNEDDQQGCVAGENFNYTDIGVRSTYFSYSNGYQAPFEQFVRPALPFQVLNYTEDNHGAMMTGQFDVTCFIDTFCSASPFLASFGALSGIIYQYRLVDCNASFPAECTWHSENGTLTCTLTSDISPVSWNVYVDGPDGQQWFVMTLDDGGFYPTTGTTGTTGMNIIIIIWLVCFWVLRMHVPDFMYFVHLGTTGTTGTTGLVAVVPDEDDETAIGLIAGILAGIFVLVLLGIVVIVYMAFQTAPAAAATSPSGIPLSRVSRSRRSRSPGGHTD